MKKFLFAALFFMISAGQAQAAWTDDFLKDYDAFGIDRAVDNALENDITPNDILKFISSQNDAFKTKITMKALYCAGVDQDVMKEAAEKLGIGADDLGVALAESTEECGSKLALNDRDILDVPGDNGGNGHSGNSNDNDNNNGGGNNSGGSSSHGHSGNSSNGGGNRPRPASPSLPNQLN